MSKIPLGAAIDNPDRASGPAGDNYVVVARRYRPQTFGDLVGQEPVARALTNAITANRVGHAYLFTGARGVGKTSSARILAKALNCVEGPTPTPCNVCDICQRISTGDDVDVLEIDGASNRGIDEIRELRQNVNIRPSRSRFKIYIIDEVHMLTTPAFNALLKTLEEPPERVKFIFCTTEAEKIPITILSRCQRFDFAGIETNSIAARLRQIAVAEGVEADDEALELLARRAAGSMRDSQSLLEQLLSFGGQRITAADVHALLGTAASGRMLTLVEHVTQGNSGAALDAFDQILAEGVDVGQLLVQLSGFYRDVLVMAVGGSKANLLFSGPAELPLIERAAKQMGVESVLAVMQILDQALGRMRYVTQPRVIAELALVRIARLENLTALGELVQSLRSGEIDDLPETPARPSTPMASVGSTVEPLKKNSVEVAKPVAIDAVPSAEIALPQPTRPFDAANAALIWRDAVASLGDDTVVEFALTARDVRLEPDGKLVVSFPAEYSYSRTMCQRPEKLAKLGQAIAALTSGFSKLELELLPAATRSVPAGEAIGAARTGKPRDRMSESAEHPLVRKAIDLFGARPVRVEEPKA